MQEGYKPATKLGLKMTARALFGGKVSGLELQIADHLRGNYVFSSKGGNKPIEVVCHIPDLNIPEESTRGFEEEIMASYILGILFPDNYSKLHEEGAKLVDGKNPVVNLLGFAPREEKVRYFIREKASGEPVEDIDWNLIPFGERVGIFYNMVKAIRSGHLEGFTFRNLEEDKFKIGKSVQVTNLRAATARGDPKVDIKSLGEVAYTILTGRQYSPSEFKKNPHITGIADLDLALFTAMNNGFSSIFDMEREVGNIQKKFVA